MATDVKNNTETEFVPPHPTNYIRAINDAMAKQLREEDTSLLEVPTLLSRAKSLVNRKNYIALMTTKEG